MKQCTRCSKVYDDYLFCCPSCGNSQSIPVGGTVNGSVVQPAVQPVKKKSKAPVIISVVAVLFLFIIGGAVAVFLFSDDDLPVDSYVPQSTAPQSSAAAPKTKNGIVYYGSVREFAEALRDSQVNREPQFKGYLYCNDTDDLDDICSSIYDLAHSMELSVSYEDGDYLNNTLGEAEFNYGYDGVSNDVLFEYNSTYSDTLKQEKKIDDFCVEFIEEYGLNNMSDYERVKTIHDYLVDTITYDDSSDPYNYNAYGALIKHKCACQGYATAFYRICKMCGMNVKCVSSKDHMWNLIMLDGVYYHIDCTAADSGAEGEIYYDRFLLGSDNAGDIGKLEKRFTTDEFKKTYPVSKTDYPERPDDVLND